MNIRTRKPGLFLSVVAGTLLASVSPAHAQSMTSEKWQYEFSPYLWMAGLSGTTRVGPLSVNSSISFSDLLSEFDIGASGTFEARKGRWGVLFDGIYMKLSDSQGNVDLKVTQQMYSLSGMWRATEGDKPVDLLAGLRYNYLKPTLEVPFGSRSQTRATWDPFIGIRGMLPLSQRWTLVGYADIGTFNGGNGAWQFLVGANYASSDTVSAKLGYRYYKTQHSSGILEYDNTTQGFYVGAGIRF